MLNENKTSKSSSPVGKYLLYAIGEIALVVIGILIALQINTSNTHRIERNKEKIILRDIQEEIQLDTLDMNWNLDVHISTIKNEQMLFELLSGGNQPDSINYAVALGMPLVSVVHTATYSALSNNNPDLISNQKLKKMIYNHYDFFYTALTELENRSSELKMYSKLMPYFEKHFTTTVNKSNVLISTNNSEYYFERNYERNDLIPNNIEAMKADHGFKVALSEVMFARSVLISVYKESLNRIKTLSEAIDEELAK